MFKLGEYLMDKSSGFKGQVFVKTESLDDGIKYGMIGSGIGLDGNCLQWFDEDNLIHIKNPWLKQN